eukprot:SAG31_NODE_2575_length_5453_cov_7.045013_4_plen_89_part_00
MYAYEQALQCRPQYIRAHVNMGMAYSAAGRADEAAKSYATAMEHAAASALRLLQLSASCSLTSHRLFNSARSRPSAHASYAFLVRFCF